MDPAKGEPLGPVTFTADDFGLSVAVNEAVELAHREGVLDAASLMVAGEAAEDAVARARANPALLVGLHVVAVEGPAVLPPRQIPDLVDAAGRFPSAQARLGVRYAVSSAARAQLHLEIRAQYAAFAATGLALDHVNAHKHMHLHPFVARCVIDAGREFGLRAIRVPAEPPRVMAACGVPANAGARALHAWTRVLRRMAGRARLATTDSCFGIAWSGHMTTERLLRLADNLPPGPVEIYCHPAARRDPLLDRLMPDYEHEAELAALLDPRVAAAFAKGRT